MSLFLEASRLINDSIDEAMYSQLDMDSKRDINVMINRVESSAELSDKEKRGLLKQLNELVPKNGGSRRKKRGKSRRVKRKSRR